MPLIIPAVLEPTIEQVLKTVALVPQAHHWHLDIMDDQFVHTSVKFSSDDLEHLPKTLVWDLHLMVEDPTPWVMKGLQLANTRTLYLHVESDVCVGKLLHHIHHAGRSKALAINPTTHENRLNHFIPGVDEILVMGVMPGAQGRSMEPETIDRISHIHQQYPSSTIGVDGGIRLEYVRDLLNAGAEELVVGSAIVKSQNPDTSYRQFVETIH